MLRKKMNNREIKLNQIDESIRLSNPDINKK